MADEGRRRRGLTVLPPYNDSLNPGPAYEQPIEAPIASSGGGQPNHVAPGSSLIARAISGTFKLTMQTRALSVFLISVATIMAGELAGADWPQFLGPARTGVYSGLGRTVRALVALEAPPAAMALALADGSEWAPAVRATPHYLT